MKKFYMFDPTSPKDYLECFFIGDVMFREVSFNLGYEVVPLKHFDEWGPMDAWENCRLFESEDAVCEYLENRKKQKLV